MIGETLPNEEKRSTTLEKLVQNYEANLNKVLNTLYNLEDVIDTFVGQVDEQQTDNIHDSSESRNRVCYSVYDKIDDFNVGLSAIDYRLNKIIKKL